MLNNFLLYHSLLSFEDPIESARNSKADGFHIDVMDGIVVKNICDQHQIIPELKTLKKPIQVHLMGTQALLPEIIAVKPDTVFVHPCWCDNILQVIYELRENGIAAGIVWDDDGAETYFDLGDEVLFMTVIPGASGQALIKSRVEKVKNLLINKPCWIDGGINAETIKFFDFLPISGFVAGSGIASFIQQKPIFPFLNMLK